jgi:hypothetical protein
MGPFIHAVADLEPAVVASIAIVLFSIFFEFILPYFLKIFSKAGKIVAV